MKEALIGLHEDGVAKLNETVIRGGYCIGCGACAIASGSPFEIALNSRGQFEARLSEEAVAGDLKYDPSQVCPFADGTPDEDAIARNAGLDVGEYHDGIGFSLAAFAGHVTESDYREAGSSGGLVSWLLCELLDKGLVDGVIHVRDNAGAARGDRLMFAMSVSYTAAEVRSGAKSRYYPVEMSDILEQVREHPGRYALVGVPCFIKAARLLANHEPWVRERIAYHISLVCGHLKSENFARMLAWSAGIEPEDLVSIDFRKKLMDRPANQYGVEFVTRGQQRDQTREQKHHQKSVVPIRELYGYDWGLGFFKYKACDFCDDVVGETADVSIGDAWLPEYVNDPQGTNVVVVRQPKILKLLEDAMADGRLSLEKVTASKVVASQAGGLRHRRQGLAYRLQMVDERGEWRPKKRVQPAKDHLTKREQSIQDARMQLRELSHIAFEHALRQGDWSIFVEQTTPLVNAYRRLYRTSMIKRALGRIRRGLASAARRVKP